MSKHPPGPVTTVLVVVANELVATSTPGAISVKLPIALVYHRIWRAPRLGWKMVSRGRIRLGGTIVAERTA